MADPNIQEGDHGRLIAITRACLAILPKKAERLQSVIWPAAVTVNLEYSLTGRQDGAPISVRIGFRLAIIDVCRATL